MRTSKFITLADTSALQPLAVSDTARSTTQRVCAPTHTAPCASRPDESQSRDRAYSTPLSVLVRISFFGANALDTPTYLRNGRQDVLGRGCEMSTGKRAIAPLTHHTTAWRLHPDHSPTSERREPRRVPRGYGQMHRDSNHINLAGPTHSERGYSQEDSLALQQ
jgi:hypothetical protein